MLLVENVRKSYREPNGERLPILNVARLELSAGEQAVIRGRSGGGKTTLLNVIAGLASVDEGRILINKTDLTRLPRLSEISSGPDKSASCFKRSTCWPDSARWKTCSSA